MDTPFSHSDICDYNFNRVIRSRLAGPNKTKCIFINMHFYFQNVTLAAADPVCCNDIDNGACLAHHFLMPTIR
jgi:hypothetical protein